MTIKEIEEITGMARANIRYYESEGLITPERKENGYRVYSEADGLALLKIKLLRSLDVSIDTLKEIQTGNRCLEDALRQSLASQIQKQQQLERTREVTQRMLRDNASYETLDASFYLQRLESDEVLQTDRAEVLNLPWRRFWARDLDVLICSILVGWLSPEDTAQVIHHIMTLAALVLLEPLCLHLFAATPGKAIFGIRVTDLEGGRLAYGEAMKRLCCVLWEGECMRVPVLSLYFHYRSYQAAENDELLPWEENSELTIRDDKLWRYLLYALAWTGILALDVAVLLLKEGIL